MRGLVDDCLKSKTSSKEEGGNDKYCDVKGMAEHETGSGSRNEVALRDFDRRKYQNFQSKLTLIGSGVMHRDVSTRREVFKIVSENKSPF